MRLLTCLALLFGLLLGCDESSTVESTPEVEEAPETTRDPHADGPTDPAFAPMTDAEMASAISAARERARARDARVLLVFIADWCPDCHEVVRVSRLGAAAQVLADKYEVVHVDVGGWDRHQALRERFHVSRIATLVVLDPDDARVAQTTLEPISRHQALTPEALAAWLAAPRDA